MQLSQHIEAKEAVHDDDQTTILQESFLLVSLHDLEGSRRSGHRRHAVT